MLTLEEACEAIVDCEHKTAPVDPHGDCFAVGTPAMRGNRIDYDQARRISHETFVLWTRRLAPQAGDLLLAREAPVGPVVQVPDTLRVAPGQRTVLLRPDPTKLDSTFAYYLLVSPAQQSRLLQKAEGSTVPHLNVADVRSFELPPLPSLAEQRGIAATLGALDDKIESNRRSVELGLALLDALAAAAANEVPAVVALREIAVVSRETTNPTGFGTTPVDHYSIPAFDSAAWPERVDASSIMSNKLLIGRQSILVSRLNPRFNRTWWCVPDAGVPALASTEFLVLSTADPDDLGSLWLALRDEFFRDELMRRVTGTSGSHQRIRPEDALNIEVPDVRLLPAERRRQVLDLLAMVHQRRSESRHLARLRDALLPELLSGRIRVPEASEILEATA